jgi:hypothetical protein
MARRAVVSFNAVLLERVNFASMPQEVRRVSELFMTMPRDRCHGDELWRRRHLLV